MVRDCEQLLVRRQPDFPRCFAVPIPERQESLLKLLSLLEHGDLLHKVIQSVFGPG
jgi:hypothetical protein